MLTSPRGQLHRSAMAAGGQRNRAGLGVCTAQLPKQWWKRRDLGSAVQSTRGCYSLSEAALLQLPEPELFQHSVKVGFLRTKRSWEAREAGALQGCHALLPGRWASAPHRRPDIRGWLVPEGWGPHRASHSPPASRLHLLAGHSLRQL